jgi:hypothetical protein
MVNNRDRRFEQIALTSVTTSISSMLLTIIAAMNIWSYFGTFMAEHHTAMVISLIAVVLFSQMTIFLVTEYHFPCNSKNTLTIILILLQSSITSTIKVCIVSPIAAILTFILCFITLLYFAIVNSQEPGDEVSK